MTEEFTAVYRMHSLLPDAFSFRRHQDGGEVVACEFMAVAGGRGSRSLQPRCRTTTCSTRSPPAIPARWSLHNYPNGLRKLHKKDAIFLDIAATDVLRDRERGVPRYCASAAISACACPRASRTSRPIPSGSVSSPPSTNRSSRWICWSDCIARQPPPGFGFSDTAFRIFILMASRRLKSDRFFTADFTPKVYTPAGFAWIQDNNMRERAGAAPAPHMRPHFANVRNVFFPWDK